MNYVVTLAIIIIPMFVIVGLGEWAWNKFKDEGADIEPSPLYNAKLWREDEEQW